MADKRTEELPLMVIELVETPPAKPTGRRNIADLDETTTINDDDILLLQRGNRTFKISKANLLAGNDHAYGEIYTEDGQAQSPAVTQTPGTSPVLYTGWTANGVSDGTTPDHTADTVAVESAGVYQISFSASFSGAFNSTWHFEVWQGLEGGGTPAATHIHMERKLGGGGDVGTASAGGLLSLSAGEAVGMYLSAGAGDNIDTHEAQFSVVKVG